MHNLYEFNDISFLMLHLKNSNCFVYILFKVAYVLPIIQKLLLEPLTLVKDNDHSEPQVVIMAPTRELAVQIKTVVMKLSRGTDILSLVCYGGTSVSHQKNNILVS